MHNVADSNLFSSCQVVVCDLDGTLYLDNTPFPGAVLFLERVLSSGRQLFYFTNNNSLSRTSWLDKLCRFGFPVDHNQLITSTDCAETYLKQNQIYPDIYLVGNTDLKNDFESRGFNCLSEEEALDHSPQAVVLGFDTELSYEKINTCYQLITRDIPYIATHPDILCPVGKNRFKPDIGSFIALFESATQGRRPVVVGKPTRRAVITITEKAGVPVEHIAFIGDRLYTDIRMADNYGMVGILVLSGETTEEMVSTSSDSPKIIVDSVEDLINYI